MTMFSLLALLSLFTLADAVPQATPSKRNCVGTIHSLNDVAKAVQCTTVNIGSFTVPAGQTFRLDLLQGTTVNVMGDIKFGVAHWQGPLFEITGKDITFNGNGKKWDGNGPMYWDGLGSSSSQRKPSPMINIFMTGTFADVYAVNSPAQGFGVGGPGCLLVKDCTLDDREGDSANSKSNGQAAGHNTDGFNVGGDHITIQGCTVYNQDDCMAIKFGSEIDIRGNYCFNGHGISVGSVESNTVVQDVTIESNTIKNSEQGLRIKVSKHASNSVVKNIKFSGNYVEGCWRYGFLLDQSYPEIFGSPGNGVSISGIQFNGATNSIQVNNDAHAVGVNCGQGSCHGPWDWSSLRTSGGEQYMKNNCPSVNGFHI